MSGLRMQRIDVEITIVHQDLEHLDRLEADTLLLFLPDEEGPFAGFAGLVDWRLTGGLSRYLIKGWLRGEMGKSYLMPAAGRLPVQRLLGIGIGRPGQLDMRSVENLAELAGGKLAAARSTSVACALPGEPTSRDEVRSTFRVLRRGLSRHFDGRLVLIGDAKLLREVVESDS